MIMEVVKKMDAPKHLKINGEDCETKMPNAFAFGGRRHTPLPQPSPMASKLAMRSFAIDYITTLIIQNYHSVNIFWLNPGHLF